MHYVKGQFQCNILTSCKHTSLVIIRHHNFRNEGEISLYGLSVLSSWTFVWSVHVFECGAFLLQISHLKHCSPAQAHSFRQHFGFYTSATFRQTVALCENNTFIWIRQPSEEANTEDSSKNTAPVTTFTTMQCFVVWQDAGLVSLIQASKHSW